MLCVTYCLLSFENLLVKIALVANSYKETLRNKLLSILYIENKFLESSPNQIQGEMGQCN